MACVRHRDMYSEEKAGLCAQEVSSEVPGLQVGERARGSLPAFPSTVGKCHHLPSRGCLDHWTLVPSTVLGGYLLFTKYLWNV